MNHLITSYTNPDLDGVASAIVFATALMGSREIPHFAGTPNAETAGLLSALGLSDSVRFGVTTVPSIDVVLIDCHHPAQLPAFVDRDRVSLIIDHHPDGQPDAFPNATIQNEAVGAAATLIAERIEASNEVGLESLAHTYSALLACAINSNTLEFSAPSTTERDHQMFAKLKAVAEPAVNLDGLVQKMHVWNQEILSRSTRMIVDQDVKLIESPIGTVAVSQLEAAGSRKLLDRPDLRVVVDAIAAERNATASLLSLVDTESGTTYLCSSDPGVLQALRALNPTELDDFTLMLPFIALRKTHVIPALLAMKSE